MSAPPLLRVAGWNLKFEVNRSRELRHLTWIALRVVHDDVGSLELLDHPAGAAHFGCSVLIYLLAAGGEPRGVLVRRDGRPHDAESLARLSRVPPALMAEAIERMIAVGLLESVPARAEIPQPPAEIPQPPAAVPQVAAATGRDGTGRDVTDGDLPAPAEAASAGARPKAARRASPAEELARLLARRTGSSQRPCRDAVRALVESGFSLEAVRAAVEAHAAPGLAPWDFARLARGASPNGRAIPGALAAFGAALEHDRAARRPR